MSGKCNEICKRMKSRQNTDRLSLYPNKRNDFLKNQNTDLILIKKYAKVC